MSSKHPVPRTPPDPSGTVRSNRTPTTRPPLPRTSTGRRWKRRRIVRLRSAAPDGPASAQERITSTFRRFTAGSPEGPRTPGPARGRPGPPRPRAPGSVPSSRSSLVVKRPATAPGGPPCAPPAPGSPRTRPGPPRARRWAAAPRRRAPGRGSRRRRRSPRRSPRRTAPRPGRRRAGASGWALYQETKSVAEPLPARSSPGMPSLRSRAAPTQYTTAWYSSSSRCGGSDPPPTGTLPTNVTRSCSSTARRAALQRLDLLVVRRHAVPHQAVRARQPVQDVHPDARHGRLLYQRLGGVDPAGAGTDHGDTQHDGAPSAEGSSIAPGPAPRETRRCRPVTTRPSGGSPRSAGRSRRRPSPGRRCCGRPAGPPPP